MADLVFADELLPRGDAAWQLVRQLDGADFRAPIHRRAAAADLFGTEAQKHKYLPRVARGEISAFALTETDVGSDPAAMATHAEPTPDGKFFILNGEKLWCTNGTKAGVMVVMARTPPKM